MKLEDIVQRLIEIRNQSDEDQIRSKITALIQEIQDGKPEEQSKLSTAEEFVKNQCRNLDLDDKVNQ